MSPQLQVLMNQVQELFNEDKYRRIITILTDDLLEKYQSAALYAMRSKAHSSLIEVEKCFYYCNKAIEIDSTFPLSYFLRGDAWNEKKEYDKAIDDYTDAIRLDENFAAAYNNRGNAWSEKGECNKAINDYTEAIRLDENFAAAYNNRGTEWRDKKEYDKAINDYSDAIRLDENYTAAYFNRANAWREKKEYDKAINDYSDVIRLDETDAAAYFNRGISWSEKKEYDKAINDYTNAIWLDENYANAYNNRGIEWSEKKEYDNAINDYTDAIRLDENLAAAYFNLFSAYKDLKQASASLAYLNRATYLNFNQVFHLANAYHQNFLLPFMLLKVLYKSGVKEIPTLLNTFAENQSYCYGWKMIIDLINNENKYKDDELTRIRTNALINYFMGDCIESFRLYDKDIDSSDTLSLNLRDQYYYVKSCQDFLEPYESILSFALKQGETDATQSIENSYYAGQLFLLKEEAELAESFFLHAASFGFRPALYQLVSLYDKKLYNRIKRNDICDKINRSEDKNTERYSLINGISPLNITDKTDLLAEVYNLCKYYAYYAENIEEIQLVRSLLHLNYPYKRYEFWELIQFNEDAKQYFLEKINYYELLDFEQILFKAFEEYCHSQGEEKLTERISNSNQASEAQLMIGTLVNTQNTTYEKELAKKIKDMQRIQVSAKWFLVFSKLFYLQGHLSIKEAVCLHMYAEDLAIQCRDNSMLEEINLEIQVWVSALTAIPSPWLTKLFFKAFKFAQNGFASQKPEENDYKDYTNFKEKFYYHLDFWKNTLIKSFIENKMEKTT